MVKSKRTKKLKRLCVFFTILHLLCLIGPFLYFLPAAFIGGEVVSKIVLGFSTVVSIILALISFLVDFKHRAGLHRSIMWTLIAGILFCLSSIKPFIWIMAIASIFDELIFTKLKDHYHTAHLTNAEIDKRIK